MKSLAIERVTKRFGARLALDEVSLEADRGQVLTVLGPSGAGKTTLLRIVAGLEDADSGRVYLNGRCLTDGKALAAPEDRRIGMVFQDGALWPHMTVLEHVTFPLGRAGLSRAERRRRGEDTLGRCRADGLASKYPGELSGGEAQRVALARALVTEPDFLLLDEPFSGLERGLRGDLSAVVESAARRLGATVLCVTHIPDDALPFSDLVAVMSEGKVEQVGTPQEIYQRPRTRHVAELLGPVEVVTASSVKEGVAETAFGVLLVCEGGTAVARADALAWQQHGARQLAPARGGCATRPPADMSVHVVLRPGQCCADATGALCGRVVTRRFAPAGPAYLVEAGGDRVTVLCESNVEIGEPLRFRVEGRGILVP